MLWGTLEAFSTLVKMNSKQVSINNIAFRKHFRVVWTKCKIEMNGWLLVGWLL